MERYKGKHYKIYKVNIIDKIKRKTFYLYNRISYKLIDIIDKYDEFMDSLELKIEQFINNLTTKVRGQVCLKVAKDNNVRFNIGTSVG